MRLAWVAIRSTVIERIDYMTASLALKPPKVTSVIINPEVVTTGASVIISIVVEDGGSYIWSEWDSSTWGDVSNLIWGA